eukprot:TRINITY_DN12871_c0_g1_i2.p1 TRINITY_DN12871_c0_g1~~TRINITY_DN12871_c0_g1_i2.p1  ORF type:complete len:215 (-),score=51.80 TRINITY_DN12871_c0_g1_i2:13-657(-)
MGVVIFVDSEVKMHIGVCVFTLGWLAYSFFVALGHWYYKFVLFCLIPKFKATLLFKILMVIGIASFWTYLFAVLYTPDYYSSVSASVVFIALNYFFWLNFVYHSFSDSFIQVPTLLDEFVLFFTSHPSLKTEGALDQILRNSVNFTANRFFCLRLLMALLSVITLVVYCVTSYNLSEDGHKLVATINSIYILSLIHICRCRRYAVCRSRWSPYH